MLLACVAGAPTARVGDEPVAPVLRAPCGAIPEQVAAKLGVSRSTLYRELRKHRQHLATLATDDGFWS
ncbi:helix-turn-helix domain-containing protein [Streptomyces mirabilis]|uniref:helix-turn-helix domain-containing protein n=1 Tax=Streptomyces mirabilis TaxID=68239 RepID=UPI00368711CC